MKECSKSIARRLADPSFAARYFVGSGLDIGGRPDPLSLYRELFVRMGPVRTWDREDGDGELLEGVADDSYDFVHSSHCLEHLRDPRLGLRNWLRAVRPGGHLIVTVPDEDLYEQGVFPSTFNADHRWTFTVFKRSSWSTHSLNVLELICALGAAADPVKVELLVASYRFALPRIDQTLSPVGECGIEFVVRKRSSAEIAAGGRLRAAPPVEREARVHWNQYREDLRTLKRANAQRPPFADDAAL